MLLQTLYNWVRSVPSVTAEPQQPIYYLSMSCTPVRILQGLCNEMLRQDTKDIAGLGGKSRSVPEIDTTSSPTQTVVGRGRGS